MDYSITSNIDLDCLIFYNISDDVDLIVSIGGDGTFDEVVKGNLNKKKTSELLYRITNDNGKTIKEGLDVGYLSSGEQQLLILFSYIAFNKGNSSLIIIDEPELSLHIKWQEVFMKNLDLVRDSSTQIILATHSPILVNKKRSNVILLNSK